MGQLVSVKRCTYGWRRWHHHQLEKLNSSRSREIREFQSSLCESDVCVAVPLPLTHHEMAIRSPFNKEVAYEVGQGGVCPRFCDEGNPLFVGYDVSVCSKSLGSDETSTVTIPSLLNEIESKSSESNCQVIESLHGKHQPEEGLLQILSPSMVFHRPRLPPYFYGDYPLYSS